MNKIHCAAQRICILLLGLLTLMAAAVLGGFSSPLPRAAAAQPHSFNILLIGQDSRSGETARSDCMILCSYREDENKLTLTSFLRDLYVSIPGYGRNRLNAAYAFGGAKLLKKTLEQHFPVSIDGCVEVDFSCFPEVIDVLGGVTIELRADEARLLNRLHPGSTLQEGSCRLTGPQALTYARIRNLDRDGDFSRTRRQRKVLLALMDGYRDAGVVKGLSLVRKLLPYVSTDMTKDAILSYTRILAPAMGDVKLSSQTIPAAGTYSCRRIDGMDVLVADMDAAGKLLAEAAGSTPK